MSERVKERYGKQNILLVEDDADLNEIIATYLTKNGYGCTRAYSGSEARLLLKEQDRENRFGLIITDLMLPGIQGSQVVEFIRQQNQIPIIVISALENPSEKLKLFKLGVDDYLVKPFDLEELLARITVQLKHAAREQQHPGGEKPVCLVFRDWLLNPTTREFHVCGKQVKLTPTEFNILKVLLGQPQKAFSKQELFEAVWKDECFVEENAITVHVSKIRSKLKSTNTDSYIETVWGIGFRLVE